MKYKNQYAIFSPNQGQKHINRAIKQAFRMPSIHCVLHMKRNSTLSPPPKMLDMFEFMEINGYDH